MNIQKQFFHGSYKAFSKGFILTSQIDGFSNSDDMIDLEALFENNRPPGFVSRLKAVYMTDDPDLIDPGGGSVDAIYRVTPIDKPQKSDLHWYSMAQGYMEDESMDEALTCVENYWNGVMCEDDNFSCPEYRCKEAKVIKIYEINVDASDLEKVPSNKISDPSPSM